MRKCTQLAYRSSSFDELSREAKAVRCALRLVDGRSDGGAAVVGRDVHTYINLPSPPVTQQTQHNQPTKPTHTQTSVSQSLSYFTQLESYACSFRKISVSENNTATLHSAVSV